MAPKILVVDDDPILHRVLQHYLERAGYHLSTAKSGRAAIELAQRELPHLIIMDVMMPEMSGLEALRQLKSIEATKAIPVIVLTSSSLRLTHEESTASGASAFLTKPFAEGQLLTLIRELLPPSSAPDTTGGSMSRDNLK
jgi:CheY-like chemotaxis protein